MLCDELSLQLHDGVLYARARQILNLALGRRRCAIVEAALVGGSTASLIVHAVRHRVVSVTASLCPMAAMHLSKVVLPHLACALGLRGRCN